MILDYDQTARELVISIRAHRSQTALSRRLGFQSNVVYTWESGRRWPTGAQVLFACHRTGCDVREALVGFIGREPEWLDAREPWSAETVAALLRDLQGATSVSDLARRTGRARTRVSRWLSGATEPRLPDFLRLVEATSARLVDFVAALVDPETVPSVAALWRRMEARRQGAALVPWTQAVLRVLELSDYRALEAHEPGWVARRIGISLEEEERCIAFLRDTGQVRVVDGRLESDPLAVDTRRTPEVGRQLKAHWSQVAAERVKRGAPGQFSYNVFTVSRDDFERIREAHLGYFHALRAIVAESEPAEVVAIANVQLFALEDGAEADRE
jgi:transcriptional regulator with XRE-family HTH domain